VPPRPPPLPTRPREPHECTHSVSAPRHRAPSGYGRRHERDCRRPLSKGCPDFVPLCGSNSGHPLRTRGYTPPRSAREQRAPEADRPPAPSGRCNRAADRAAAARTRRAASASTAAAENTRAGASSLVGAPTRFLTGTPLGAPNERARDRDLRPAPPPRADSQASRPRWAGIALCQGLLSQGCPDFVPLCGSNSGHPLRTRQRTAPPVLLNPPEADHPPHLAGVTAALTARQHGEHTRGRPVPSGCPTSVPHRHPSRGTPSERAARPRSASSHPRPGPTPKPAGRDGPGSRLSGLLSKGVPRLCAAMRFQLGAPPANAPTDRGNPRPTTSPRSPPPPHLAGVTAPLTTPPHGEHTRECRARRVGAEVLVAGLGGPEGAHRAATRNAHRAATRNAHARLTRRNRRARTARCRPSRTSSSSSETPSASSMRRRRR
jgi:hypothetical protein